MSKLLCRIVLAIAVLVAAPCVSFGLTLPTATSNNGAGGTFMNLTSANTTLYVTSFQVFFQAAAGTAGSVQVYTRTGTYAGFTGAATGWTLVQTVPITSAGTGALASIALTTPIAIPAGTTKAVYLQCTTTGNGIRYTGTAAAPPQTTWTNVDLTLFSDSAKANATAFGTVNTVRCFSGIVNYFRDPASMGGCCRPDGTCTFGAPTDCETAPVGLWGGASSTCATVVCQQPGACCGPENAACTFTAQFSCVSPNVFTTAGSACSPTPCPQGACCKKDGSCTSVTSNWCQTTGGIYTSDGTACGAAGCAQPGACCLPNGGCNRLVEADCSALGGTFGGVGVLCASANCWTAPILYHNGGIVTVPGGGAGGTDASQLATGGNALGIGFGGAFRLAAEFTIPSGQTWDINKFHTLGYQTFTTPPAAPPPAPANPYTSLRVRIFDRDPRTAGARVLWGDTTTNVLDSTNSAFANAFRVGATLTDTARPLFDLIGIVPNVNLGPGTYWVEFGATNGASPFVPPVTTPLGIPFGYSLQTNGTTYTRALDSTYQAATWINSPGGYPYNVPFVLEGSTGTFTGVCCQTDGGCFAATNSLCSAGVFVLSGSCAPNACPQPQGGACCQSDGSCFLATAAIPAGICGVGTLVPNATCTPNACTQPQVGICCQPDGACSIATPGDATGANTATCSTGSLVVNGTCSPNTCPPPASGVCCRGATCSTAFASQAACAAALDSVTPTVASKFVSSSSVCNTPVTVPGTLGNTISPCCYANFNHNATLEVQDIFDFLNDWFAGKKAALVGGDGASGTLAVQNIFDFLNAWFAGGCS